MSCPAADSNKLHSSYIKASFINFTAAFTEIRFFLLIISSRRRAFGKSSIPSAPVFDTRKKKRGVICAKKYLLNIKYQTLPGTWETLREKNQTQLPPSQSSHSGGENKKS